MVFIKKVSNADAGDADHVGGNDWDKLEDYHDDVDVTGPARINTETRFRSGKLKFRDTGNNHNYVHNFSDLAADRTITWPLLTADDEPLFKTFAATVTGKTVDHKDNVVAERGYTCKVFKVGSTYYAQKFDGTIVSSSTTFETVFTAALALKGVTYLSNSDVTGTGQTLYDCSGALGNPGFTITSDNIIIGDSSNRTFIGVPNGYTGLLFSSRSVHLSDFGIYEQGSPARNWQAIKMSCGSGQNVSFGTFKNMHIFDSGTGIELETTHSTAFINSNIFQNVTIWSPDDVGFLIDQQSGDIDENVFLDTSIQCRTGSPQTHGFKDINGSSNVFIACKVWDPDDAVIEANIKDTADGTTILASRMTGGKGHFIDQGTKTMIMDSGNITALRLKPTPDLAKMGTWWGSLSTDADGLLQGRFQAITVGTGTSSNSADSSGIYRTYDTAATINSLTGNRGTANNLTRINNCYFKTAIYLNSVSNVRVFAGLVNDANAPTSTADPLNAKEGIALWFDSAVSANWKRMHNDSSGASTVDDTSVSAATGTLYPVEIWAVSDTKFRFVFNGTSTDISSNIPASTTGLAYWVYMENTTAASRTFRHYYVIIKNDK